MTKTKVEVTIHGMRTNGETYSDTIEVTPQEYDHLIQLLDNEIKTREGQLPMRGTEPVQQSIHRVKTTKGSKYFDEHYSAFHRWLISLICKLDI